MNQYQLNAPPHATHYRIHPTGAVIYYHIDNAVFVYEDECWREIEKTVPLKGIVEL